MSDKKIEKLNKKIQELSEALSFYAYEENWKSPSKGFALQYDPEPSKIERDRGKIATETLIRLIKI